MKQSKSLFDLCQITPGERNDHTIRNNAVAYLPKREDNEQDMEDRLLQDSEYILLRGKTNSKYSGLLREVNLSSAFAISMNAITNLKDSLPKEYQKNAMFMMNVVVLHEVARVLSAEDGKLLKCGDDQEWLLMDKPLIIYDSMPFAKRGNVPILYGDFSKVRIEDCGRSGLQYEPYSGKCDNLQCSMTGYMNCVLTDKQAVWGMKII